MHIKTGTWESSNAVCESDLCDPAVLVSPPKPEPHIRNRRLSPGSGSCGGGGGGCVTGVPDKPLRQASPPIPEGTLNGTSHTLQAYTSTRDRERRVQNKGRGPRRDSSRLRTRATDRSHRQNQNQSQPQNQTQNQKERWVEDSLTLLKPPPAFPVKDSPAKLQPAVSYASKVKAGGVVGGAAEEPPGIGVLLQNQWGLSFISDGPAEAFTVLPNQPGSLPHPITGDLAGETSTSVTSLLQSDHWRKDAGSSGDLLLSCRHLVEAVQYHMQEWDVTYHRHKEDPVKVVWYSSSTDQPA
ncbi:uncharacterized protein LOC115820888 [Chanos chanos]|uniref:Uncharacterized protein LOC115820888 n=1 Tax=Chanos chanos TaxID=29144 RepID=A0A6J2W946_CHACN|nr:uncharacterized protein LOC115820888 [Chanos chanos]